MQLDAGRPGLSTGQHSFQLIRQRVYLLSELEPPLIAVDLDSRQPLYEIVPQAFGLGPELICTIQLQHIRRIKALDIIGSTIEVSGDWRIAWNRAWIEAGGNIGTGGKGLSPI